MNARTEIAALNAEYAASKGIGLTLAKLRAEAAVEHESHFPDDEFVTLFFDEDREVFTCGDHGLEYGHGDLTLIGAYVGSTDEEDGFCISREDAITRWGQRAIYECEEFFDARRT